MGLKEILVDIDGQPKFDRPKFLLWLERKNYVKLRDNKSQVTIKYVRKLTNDCKTENQLLAEYANLHGVKKSELNQYL